MLFTSKPRYDNYHQLTIFDENGIDIEKPKAEHGQMIVVQHGQGGSFLGAIIGVGMPNGSMFQLEASNAADFITHLGNRMLSDAEILECQYHLMYAAVGCNESASAYGSLSLDATNKPAVLGRQLPIYEKRLVLPKEWFGSLNDGRAEYQFLYGFRFYGNGYRLFYFADNDCEIVHPLHMVLVDGNPHQLSDDNMRRLQEWGISVAEKRKKLKTRRLAKDMKKWSRFTPNSTQIELPSAQR